MSEIAINKSVRKYAFLEHKILLKGRYFYENERMTYVSKDRFRRDPLKTDHVELLVSLIYLAFMVH